MSSCAGMAAPKADAPTASSAGPAVAAAAVVSEGRYRPLIRPEEMLVLATRQLDRDVEPLARASTLFQRGKAQLLLENDDEALADFSDALRLHASASPTGSRLDASSAPSMVAVIHFYRGFCYARVGHHTRAVEEYTAALERCPTFARALYERAASYNTLGDFDTAIADYEAALACEESVSKRRAAGQGDREGTCWQALPDAPFALPTRHTGRPRSRFAEARLRGQPTDSIYAELVKARQEQQRQQAQHQAKANLTAIRDDVDTYGSMTSLPADGDDDAVAELACSASTSSSRHSGGQSGRAARLGERMEPDEDCAAMSAVDPVDVLSRTSSMGTMSALSSISSDEDSAHVYYQRGLYHRRRGELDEAIAMYTRAIELDAHHLKAYFNRAFCHDKLGALDAAVDDYTTALRLDRRSAYAWYNLGIAYDRQGQYERAVECFTRAIELEPHNADFYHNRGYSRRKIGSYVDAIEDYTYAISIDPQHFKSHYNRAFCHDKVGNYASAIADYTKALSIEATNVGAYFNRGIAHERLHQYREAISDYAKAAELDPQAAYALNAYALMLDHLGRHEEAERVFSAAIVLDPSSARLYHNRGYTYRNMGDLEKAVEDYTAALARDPSLVVAYENRAFVLRKLERYKEAARDYSHIAEQCPEERLKALNNRAYCHARLEQYEDAIQDYTRVIALDRFNTHALHNRGISYDKAGFHAEAIDDFTKCIQLAPDSPGSANAYYSRGLSFLALQQVEEAARDLEVAVQLDVAAQMAEKGDDSRSTVSALRRAHPAYAILRRLRTHGHKHRHTSSKHSTVIKPRRDSKHRRGSQ